jgi:dihydroflavonol-4-reductase
MRSVLVTGGTGFIGSNLSRALVAEGCAVRILRRPDSDLRALGDLEVEHVIGDILNPASVRRAVRGCDTVFHTAAIVSYWRREREQMMRVQVEGTRNIVEASLEAGVQRFVHTSSIAAIGYRDDGGLADESTEFNWHRFDVGYRIAKFRAEQEVLRGVKLGLPAVVVNPAVVVGAGDIHLHGGQIVRDVYRRRIFYYIDGGMNVVSVDDVVRGHINAARQGRVGERYILSGENLTHREVFTIAAEVVGGIKPMLKLPRFLVRMLANVVEALANLLNTRPWVARELVAGIGIHSWFTSDKAKRELLHTITPYRRAIRQAFVWYRKHRVL